MASIINYGLSKWRFTERLGYYAKFQNTNLEDLNIRALFSEIIEQIFL
jgi:hypothetical protein